MQRCVKKYFRHTKRWRMCRERPRTPQDHYATGKISQLRLGEGRTRRGRRAYWVSAAHVARTLRSCARRMAAPRQADMVAKMGELEAPCSSSFSADAADGVERGLMIPRHCVQRNARHSIVRPYCIVPIPYFNIIVTLGAVLFVALCKYCS